MFATVEEDVLTESASWSIRMICNDMSNDMVHAMQGPPVAVTEFAAMNQEENVQAAVAEAGLMAAMERNCHKVIFFFHTGRWHV